MIERAEQTEAYIGFFGSEAGKMFMEQLDTLIDDAHRTAENIDMTGPSACHALMARASGIRQVKEHIQTIMTPLRQGKHMDK